MEVGPVRPEVQAALKAASTVPPGVRESESGPCIASALLVSLPSRQRRSRRSLSFYPTAPRAARRRYVRLARPLPHRPRDTRPRWGCSRRSTRVLQRWWRRLLAGQGSVALEVHALPGPAGRPRASSPSRARSAVRAVEAAVRTAYPNTPSQPFPARSPARRRPAAEEAALFVTRSRSPTRASPGRPLWTGCSPPWRRPAACAVQSR